VLTSAAEAAIILLLTAALKRCATQNQICFIGTTKVVPFPIFVCEILLRP
jgi:hypothetical protein